MDRHPSPPVSYSTTSTLKTYAYTAIAFFFPHPFPPYLTTIFRDIRSSPARTATM